MARCLRFRLRLLTIFLLSCVCAQARHLTGRVVDDETGQSLPGVTVELLSPKDSSVIRATVTAEKLFFGQKEQLYDIDVDNHTTYLLRFSMVGYATQYKKVEVRMAERMNVQWMSEVRLKADSKLLSEVVVKATKIKMVLHGDTMVYNADAFSLSEGSMLDALIRQMPGTTIDNGVIKVNGRVVSSLLVDGRDFFNGDAKAALKNLPAYTVDKVRVYDKGGKSSRLMGRNMGDKALVLDVGLKKDYQRGLLGNTEWGLGSQRRYSGKAFALGYSKHSRLTLTGVMNNVNDGGVPGEDGSASSMPDAGGGLSSMRQIGLGYRIEGNNEDTYLSTDNDYSFTDGDMQNRSNSQTFLTGGDYYSVSRSSNRSRSRSWSSNESFGLGSKRHMLGGNLSLSHSSGDANGSSLSGRFNAKPADNALDSLFTSEAAWLRTVVNRQRAERQRHSRSSSYSVGFNDRLRVGNDKWNDMASMAASASYSRSTATAFSTNSIDYLDGTTAPDNRYQYTPNSSHRYEIDFNADYSKLLNADSDKVNTIYLRPSYRLNKQYSSEDNSLYRLDRLDDYTEETYALGMLPSTKEALMATLDGANSYWSNSHRLSNFGSLLFNYSHDNEHHGPKISLMLNLPVEWRYESLGYFRQKKYEKRRNSVFFQPSLSAQVSQTDSISMNSLSFSYSTSQSQPDLASQLDIRDDSNPLTVTLGNPGLKKSRTHALALNLSLLNIPRQRFVNASLSYNVTQDAIATATLYDKQTGRTTTQQQNINGNWNVSAGIMYGRPLDKNQHFLLNESLNGSYARGVDLTTVEGSTAERSKVGNWNLTNRFRLVFQLGDRMRLNLTSDVAYQRATSPRPGFQLVSAWNYNFGASGFVTLPFGLELSTDMVNYNRSGYNDEQMNKSEWIWNARLTKYLLGKRLALAIDGFDILGQLNSTTLTLNSQGRTEAWANSIPRYLMLRCSYKFTAGGKRRQRNPYYDAGELEE